MNKAKLSIQDAQAIIQLVRAAPHENLTSAETAAAVLQRFVAFVNAANAPKKAKKNDVPATGQ